MTDPTDRGTRLGRGPHTVPVPLDLIADPRANAEHLLVYVGWAALHENKKLAEPRALPRALPDPYRTDLAELFDLPTDTVLDRLVELERMGWIGSNGLVLLAPSSE